MKDFLEHVVRQLVTNPDAVEVTVTQGENLSILLLKVDQADVGRVIGKEGRTVGALRTLLMAIASRQSQRIALEIAES
jgi:predicted RNA-binding protein YlqC (UPF0109 family)